MQGRNATTWITYGLIAVVLVAPVAAWWWSVGNPSIYFTHDLPAGQGLYAFAKLAGLLGFALLWVQALLGMAPRVPLFRGLPVISRSAHIGLGCGAAMLIVAHVGLFVAGSSLRKKTVAWELLLPNLDHGYYFQMITLGAVALYLLVIALFAGWRLRRGHRRWKAVHMLWPAIFALALVHSITIGSESRYGVLVYVFFFMGSSLALIVLARTATWLGTRRAKAAIARDGSKLASDASTH